MMRFWTHTSPETINCDEASQAQPALVDDADLGNADMLKRNIHIGL